MQKVNDIREKFVSAYKNKEFVKDKSGVDTIELIGESFIADEDTIFGKVNKEYIDREIEWYLSQSLYVKDIPGVVPKIWEQVADFNGKINSNYGWCIFSIKNGSQYRRVRETLKCHQDSRRAVMIYNRPSMHEDYNINGRSDFMCTNAVQYMIRNKTLFVVVQMRSNDVVFGYRNDFAWQEFVATKLYHEIWQDITIDTIKIIWNAGSLHVYEKDFWRIKCWAETGENMSKSQWVAHQAPENPKNNIQRWD